MASSVTEGLTVTSSPVEVPKGAVLSAGFTMTLLEPVVLPYVAVMVTGVSRSTAGAVNVEVAVPVVPELLDVSLMDPREAAKLTVEGGGATPPPAGMPGVL